MQIKIREIKVKERDKVMFAKLLVKVTFIMVCISVGIKLLGFNLFDANQSNSILLFISKVIYKYNLLHLINFLLLFIQMFIIFRISCKNKNRKAYYVATILTSVLILYIQIFIISEYFASSEFAGTLYFIFTFFIVVLTSVIIDMKEKYEKKSNKTLIVGLTIKIWDRIKKPIAMLLLISIYQVLVLFLRNLTFYADRHYDVYNFLLNFDYIILLVASYYVFIKKENGLVIKSSSTFKLINFLHNRPSSEEMKVIVGEVKEKYVEFKTKDKEDQLVQILYVTFFIIVELVNLGLVIFIANLNHYLIECIFIMIGFLVSRKIFGAFHFKSAITCFVVSNISFYILNTVTFNTDLSFAIPIFLGLALSLGTSLFIKKTNKTLYRGMTKNELLDICKDKELNTMEMDILEDFYCNRESLVKLTYKHHYSRTAIIVFKREALEKIRT